MLNLGKLSCRAYAILHKNTLIILYKTNIAISEDLRYNINVSRKVFPEIHKN